VCFHAHDGSIRELGVLVGAVTSCVRGLPMRRASRRGQGTLLLATFGLVMALDSTEATRGHLLPGVRSGGVGTRLLQTARFPAQKWGKMVYSRRRAERACGFSAERGGGLRARPAARSRDQQANRRVSCTAAGLLQNKKLVCVIKALAQLQTSHRSVCSAPCRHICAMNL
jgi:hypothetical protein